MYSKSRWSLIMTYQREYPHSFTLFLPLTLEPEIVKIIFIVSADRVGLVAKVSLLTYVLW